MASGNRKASVLAADLPPVIKLGEDSFGYLTRYRIVSEDQNRFSAWSPVQEVVAFDATLLPGTVSGDIAVMGNSVLVTWGDALNRPSYDIFVSFDGKDYIYHGTSPIHTYSFLNQDPDTDLPATSIDVIIQIESINKSVENILTICELYSIMES